MTREQLKKEIVHTCKKVDSMLEQDDFYSIIELLSKKKEKNE